MSLPLSDVVLMCPDGWVAITGDGIDGVRCADFSAITGHLETLANRAMYFSDRSAEYVEPIAFVVGLVILLLAITAAAVVLK